MSEELEATLERIAEQQEANTAAIAALAERQADFDTRIARLLQITERYVTQTDANTARLDRIDPST